MHGYFAGLYGTRALPRELLRYEMHEIAFQKRLRARRPVLPNKLRDAAWLVGSLITLPHVLLTSQGRPMTTGFSVRSLRSVFCCAVRVVIALAITVTTGTTGK